MLKPLDNRVVLRVTKEEEKTQGGIVLASAAQEKPQTAEVLAVGPGRMTNHGKLIEPAVKVGDKVIFEKFSGASVALDDEEVLIVKDSDILAIIE
ncbi:co-chaperone GroES [Lactococcus termiticola]|uniref:Co-chaperonin GroES n=1 Tax=Lactococcus termiticola TaxID=2169526 RepID=A0A2R5HFF5_9LACT|nr:co-chaperone GroES [Lactococcus termiticola]GBG96035.1 co-chaperonin GroES [Lactococcus termiticola]